MPVPSNVASLTSADILRLVRGYPPVLGAMLLVDGVITLILGGDSTVTLGEVVAYLLLPPLAMFLVTQTTGGRRPNAVTLGVTVAGAAVLLAALFLLGGVHLVTLPPWVLALAGAALLVVALFVMRLTAPTQEEQEVPSLLNPSERAGFDEFGSAPRDEFGSAAHGGYDSAAHGGYDSAARDEFGSAPREEFGSAPREEFGSAPREEFGSAPRDYDRPAEPEWPPSRRDDPPSHSADETVHGLPRVPGHSAGPPEPEWPPRREPIGAPWSTESRPEPAATWSAEPAATWSAEPEPNWSSGPADRPAGPADRSFGPADGPAGPADRSFGPADGPAGPADREWPPATAAAEWPPRRDPEPAPAAEQRSWFDTDEAQPAEPSWSSGPPDGEWPPSERSYQSGRRSRHPDQ